MPNEFESDTGCEGPAPACTNPRCREPLAEDGSCWFCETAACEACGSVVPSSALVPVTDNGTALRCCPGCAGDASDGVPVAVDEEETSAQTVRIESEPTEELAAEWCEKLDAQEAA